MNIQIMSYVQAIKHIPQIPTFMIRIFDPYSNNPNKKIQPSDLYTIKEYIFEEVPVEMMVRHYDKTMEEINQNPNLFKPNLAKQIIKDFAKEKDQCLELIVHCTLGACRSPAIAIALNDIFKLGQDSEELKSKNPTYDKYVYNLMLKVNNN